MPGDVERFELPNLLAVNFLLHQSLGGGGTASLLLDAQAKTYAQYLLAAEVEVPEGLIDADIESHIDRNHAVFKANRERMQRLVAELRVAACRGARGRRR